MSEETLASDTVGLNENNGGKSRHINKIWLFHRHRGGLAVCQTARCLVSEQLCWRCQKIDKNKTDNSSIIITLHQELLPSLF